MRSCEVCDSAEVRVISTLAPSKRNFGKCSNCGLFQNIDKKLPLEIEGVDFVGYLSAQDETFEKLRRTTVLLRIKRFPTHNQLVKVIDLELHPIL